MPMEEAYKEKIKLLVDEQDQLNAWEKKFLRSMVKAVDNNWPLSPGRKNKIDDIVNKVQGNGEPDSSTNNAVETGDAKAELGEAGWEISWKGKVCGKSVTKNEAKTIVSWLSNGGAADLKEAIDDLPYMGPNEVDDAATDFPPADTEPVSDFPSTGDASAPAF